MSHQYMTEQEIDEFGDLLLDIPGCPGAEAFPMAGVFEIHPRGADFPEPVRDWLSEHGFRRATDPQRGPFYYRAAPNISLSDAAERLGLSRETLRVQIHNNRLHAVKRGRDWYLTEYEIERYREQHLGQVGRPTTR